MDTGNSIRRVCLISFASRGNLGDDALLNLAMVHYRSESKGGVRVICIGKTPGTAGLAGRFMAMRMAARWSDDIEFIGGYLHGSTGGALGTALATLSGLAWEKRLGAEFQVLFRGAGIGPFDSLSRKFLKYLTGSLRVQGSFRDSSSITLASDIFGKDAIIAQADPIALMPLESGDSDVIRAGEDFGRPCLIPRHIPGMDSLDFYLGIARDIRSILGVFPELAVTRPSDLRLAGAIAGKFRTVLRSECSGVNSRDRVTCGGTESVAILSNPVTAAQFLARRSLLVSARYHGCILGMRAGTPTLALAIDPKLLYLDDAFQAMRRAGLNPGQLTVFPQTFLIERTMSRFMANAVKFLFRRRIAFFVPSSAQRS